MVKDEFQLTFEFDVQKENVVNDDIKESIDSEKIENKADAEISINNEKTLSSKDMRRAILGWILDHKPTGVGLQVPARISKFLADVAAFWSMPISINGKKYLAPVKTVVIEIRNNREHCWPDFGSKDELLQLLKEKKAEKKQIQKYIRTSEPELKMDDNLFSEYENWNYRKSKNKEYHACLNKVDEIEIALYNGSKFEKIRRAEIADYLYLAVPEGEVEEHELADGWGLLYIKKIYLLCRLKNLLIGTVH